MTSTALACLLILFLALPTASAQSGTIRMNTTMQAETKEETIELLVGDIMEILPTHTIQNASYVWVLTKEGEYIESSRNKTFRQRIIQPGTYTLFAEIASPDGQQRISRTFTLIYSARQPGAIPGAMTASGLTADMLVTTAPPLQDERVIMPAGTQLLRLDPINPELKPISLDMDTSLDTDNDGTPDNDVESELTFFHSDATPLHVWFASPIESRSMGITALGPEGNAIVQRIDVLSGGYAQSQGIDTDIIDLNITPVSGMQYSFAAEFNNGSPSVPLLYQWEFGDGQESLLVNPTHDYAEAGTYAVKLRVRDLSSGKDIALTEQALTVEAAAGSTTSQTSSEPTDTPSEPDGGGIALGTIGNYVLLALAFILSIGLGVGVIFLISKVRKKGINLSDKIASMEETLIKKDDAQKGDAPKPLAIMTPSSAPKPAPKAPTKEDIAAREKENAVIDKTPAAPLKVEEKNAPSWLKGGLSTPAAAPKPVEQKPAPTPAPAAAPQAPATPAPQTPPAAAPSWLKPSTPTPATSTPAASAAPKPASAPQTPPPTPPTPTPAPRPAMEKPTAPVEQPKPAPTPKPSEPASPASTPAPSAPAAPAAPTPPAPATTSQPGSQPLPPWLSPKTTPESAQQAPPPMKPAAIPPTTTPPPPSAAPTPATSPNPTADTAKEEPIAFIRADSLDQAPAPTPSPKPETPPQAAQ